MCVRDMRDGSSPPLPTFLSAKWMLSLPVIVVPRPNLNVSTKSNLTQSLHVVSGRKKVPFYFSFPKVRLFFKKIFSGVPKKDLAGSPGKVGRRAEASFSSEEEVEACFLGWVGLLPEEAAGAGASPHKRRRRRRRQGPSLLLAGEVGGLSTNVCSSSLFAGWVGGRWLGKERGRNEANGFSGEGGALARKRGGIRWRVREEKAFEMIVSYITV